MKTTNLKIKIIVASVIFGPTLIIIVLTLIFSVMNFQNEIDLRNYLRSEYSSMDSFFTIKKVELFPNYFNRVVLKNNKKYQIIVIVSCKDTKNATKEQRANTSLRIRNITEKYLESHLDKETEGEKCIELTIQYEKEHITMGQYPFFYGSYFISFTNQYDGSRNDWLNKEKISSLRLDSVISYNVKFSENELKLFSDSKSMVLDVSEIKDFSFLENFKILKYLSITNFEKEQIDQCLEHLPKGCQLYINDYTLEEYRNPYKKKFNNSR